MFALKLQHLRDYYLDELTKLHAQMAELVDALDSNSSDCKIVPVRSRLWVQRQLGAR